MNQITEESINEIGIKWVKLADKKIRLDYDAQIICEEILIETIKLKIRYKLDSDGIYKMIYPKPHFLNLISNRLRVKKSFIHYGELFYPTWTGRYTLGTNKHFEFEGMKFNNLIKSIYVSNTEWFKVWNREKQINELLK